MLVELAGDLLAGPIPPATPEAPAGTEGLISTILGWGLFALAIAGVFGVIFGAIKLNSVGRHGDGRKESLMLIGGGLLCLLLVAANLVTMLDAIAGSAV
jgi:hypothetical protein